MAHNQPPFVAEVKLEERENHIYAYSKDISGLNICGENRADVLVDVVAAVQFLYKEVHGIDVVVELAQSVKSRMSEKTDSLPHNIIEHLVMRERAHA